MGGSISAWDADHHQKRLQHTWLQGRVSTFIVLVLCSFSQPVFSRIEQHMFWTFHSSPRVWPNRCIVTSDMAVPGGPCNMFRLLQLSCGRRPHAENNFTIASRNSNWCLYFLIPNLHPQSLKVSDLLTRTSSRNQGSRQAHFTHKIHSLALCNEKHHWTRLTVEPLTSGPDTLSGKGTKNQKVRMMRKSDPRSKTVRQ